MIFCRKVDYKSLKFVISFSLLNIWDMEVELDSKVYLGSCVQLYSLAETPQLPPSPRIWAHIQGRYWSGKVTPWYTVSDFSKSPTLCN
jgi:hypothetical protein